MSYPRLSRSSIPARRSVIGQYEGTYLVGIWVFEYTFQGVPVGQREIPVRAGCENQSRVVFFQRPQRQPQGYEPVSVQRDLYGLGWANGQRVG
jgi:hypothetical protein